MTTDEKIWAALETRVAALVLSPPLAIAWPNNDFQSAPPYLRVDLFRNRNQRIAIKGSAPHRRLGILQITVVAPLNAGPVPATSIAGQIAEHFPADLVLDNDGLSVRITSAPDVLSGSKADASYDIPVSIEFEAFA
jgi:hypothetical protein